MLVERGEESSTRTIISSLMALITNSSRSEEVTFQLKERQGKAIQSGYMKEKGSGKSINEKKDTNKIQIF